MYKSLRGVHGCKEGRQRTTGKGRYTGSGTIAARSTVMQSLRPKAHSPCERTVRRRRNSRTVAFVNRAFFDTAIGRTGAAHAAVAVALAIEEDRGRGGRGPADARKGGSAALLSGSLGGGSSYWANGGLGGFGGRRGAPQEVGEAGSGRDRRAAGAGRRGGRGVRAG